MLKIRVYAGDARAAANYLAIQIFVFMLGYTEVILKRSQKGVVMVYYFLENSEDKR